MGVILVHKKNEFAAFSLMHHHTGERQYFVADFILIYYLLIPIRYTERTENKTR